MLGGMPEHTIVPPFPDAEISAQRRGRPLVYGDPLGGAPSRWCVDLPNADPVIDFPTHAEAFKFAYEWASQWRAERIRASSAPMSGGTVTVAGQVPEWRAQPMTGTAADTRLAASRAVHDAVRGPQRRTLVNATGGAIVLRYVVSTPDVAVGLAMAVRPHEARQPYMDGGRATWCYSTPQHDLHDDDVRRDDCDLLPGGVCYGDSGFLIGTELRDLLLEHGEDALWPRLETLLDEAVAR